MLGRSVLDGGCLMLRAGAVLGALMRWIGCTLTWADGLPGKCLDGLASCLTACVCLSICLYVCVSVASLVWAAEQSGRDQLSTLGRADAETRDEINKCQSYPLLSIGRCQSISRLGALAVRQWLAHTARKHASTQAHHATPGTAGPGEPRTAGTSPGARNPELDPLGGGGGLGEGANERAVLLCGA